MKHLIPLALVALVGCTLSPEKFAEKKRDLECETCEGKGNFDCEQLPNEDPEDQAGCDYDEEAAKECLKGVWSCNTDVDPIVFAESPPICEDVWECGNKN